MMSIRMLRGTGGRGSAARHTHCRLIAGGFTLLELLIALTIMTTAMTVVIACFVVTLKGWEKGGKMLDGLRHGDFVMEQLVSAIRSAAFFPTNPDRYGFWLEDENRQGVPADSISFVTSGTALMRMDSPLVNGLHRLEISVDDNPDGAQGVAVRAIPHLMDPEEWEGEVWFVSTVVKGLDCRVYDLEQEDWDDDWDDTNAVPSLVEITLHMEPLEANEPPLTISRVVEIPVAPVVANAVRFQQEELDEQDAAEGAADAEELRELQEAGLISPEDLERIDRSLQDSGIGGGRAPVDER